MKKIIQNKKIILLIVSASALALILFLVPHLAGAQVGGIISNIGIGVVTLFFKGVAYIINLFFGLLFGLAAWLVTIAMTLNDQILSNSNTLVKIGWGITRDVANLGFVLIMIVMAVATILRYQKYSAQKLLPFLIGAAIIVNFSLTIAGVFLKFADVVSNTFASKLNSGNITDAVAGAFNPQRLLIKDTDNPSPPDPAEQGNALSDFSAAALMSIMGLVFNIVFLAIATFSMATLALMLFYRYLMISFLLILSPLAWMFWVFPDLQYLFKKWWSSFIQWTFFLPATTFFLYLAVQAAEELGKQPVFSQGGLFTSSGFASVISQGAQMIVLTGILLGGLIVAQKIGIAGAAGAMKLAGKAKEAAGKYAGNRARQIATAPLRGSLGKKATEKLQTLGNKLPRGTRFIGAPLRGLGNVLAKTRMAQEKRAADEAKKLPKDLKEQALMANSATAPERVAIMANVSKERNTRKKKKDAAEKKLAPAQQKLSTIEEQENGELNNLQGDDKLDMGKTSAIKAKYASAKQAAKDAVDNAQKDVNEATKAINEIDEVIETLPKNIQDAFEKSRGKNKGEIEIKDIKLAQRYGYRKGSVMPGQSAAEIVFEATQKAAKEAEEAEKGGGEKTEKKEEKK